MTGKTEMEPMAKSMLVFMIRGLFTSLKFPYAQFPCTDLTGEELDILESLQICVLSCVGDQLFDPIWECIYHLERLGLKILGVCCDGLAANCRLISLHSSHSEALVYKVLNPHATESRYLFFFLTLPTL